MKYKKIFLLFSVSVFFINLHATNVYAATLPDLKMDIFAPYNSSRVSQVAVKGEPRTFEFIISITDGYLSGLPSTPTNLIQTATGIADSDNPTGLNNYTYKNDGSGIYNNPTESSSLRSVVFNTVGTSYVRACADRSSSSDAAGVITESDERNNCSRWMAISVVANPYVDLQTGDVNPLTVTAGVAKSFNAVIFNEAPSSTDYTGVTSFNNKFQTADYFVISPTTGETDYNQPINLIDYPLKKIEGLSPWGTYIKRFNGTTLVIDRLYDEVISQTITLNEGKFIRACADLNNLIPESDENNNCGPWKYINVTPAPVPTGTLTASDCTIPAGGKNCLSNLSWTTSLPVSGVTSEVTTSTNVTVGTGNNSIGQYSVDYGTRDFYLYHNSVLLKQVTAKASCVSGTSWTGFVCAVGGGQPDLGVSDIHFSKNSEGSFDVNATIRNWNWALNTPPGKLFSNIIQLSTLANGGGDVLDVTPNKFSSVDYNATTNLLGTIYGVVSSAKDFKFARACADKSSAADTVGVISETDETNNCGAWTAINVVSDPTLCNDATAQNYNLKLPCFYNPAFCKDPADVNYGKAACTKVIDPSDPCGGNGANNPPLCNMKCS